ncbi:unnamed protein product [Cyclocybe aegerita]|uniref:F-box domain-containing protein n=1 Tax=Cyclocybe aegerita TaxID=1973307 RepID=A0A8S0W0D1_CYCAE|nr:unnamed protein product [Cyclocybe aegerita]
MRVHSRLVPTIKDCTLVSSTHAAPRPFMHLALLIDQLLLQIFSFCLEYDRPSLVAAALTCRAWKDPALDLVWDCLLSVEPLLRLLPGISGIENISASESSSNASVAFSSYARRVKYISHRQEANNHHVIVPVTYPLFSALKLALPNLRTAHISFRRCNTSFLPLYLSPALCNLEVDLGFGKSYIDLDSMLCDYLEKTNLLPIKLERISLRGLASERLNRAISSFHHLRFISLKLGRSLLPQTVKEITTFSSLLELEIHAGHIDPDDLEDTHRHASIFKSLRKLQIRAKASFIEHVFRHLEQDTLNHLHIELDDHSPSSISWNNIFRLICDKASNTLHHLSLEHHFELPEMTPSSSASPGTSLYLNPNNTPNQVSPALPFSTMADLRRLKHVKHFVYDATVPPIIYDNDIKKLLSWWPNLEHFELGSVPQTEEGGLLPPFHMMMAALTTFAAKAPKLQKLVLPLPVDSVEGEPDGKFSVAKSTSPLMSLTVAQLETSKPSNLAAYLHRLFPALRNLDGPCDDNVAWTETRATLYALA